MLSKPMQLLQSPEVITKFESYPPHILPKLQRLRELIYETARGVPELSQLAETLKWGEPSYLTQKGSTLRIDWKAKKPEQYAIYFKCTSKLVPTFKQLYGDLFQYENNRAIVFGLEDELPIAELKACIELALTYHRVKELPLLGKG